MVILSFLPIGSDTNKGPELSFIDKRVVEYGDIQSGEKAEVYVSYKNTGDQNLLIQDVGRSCNCTEVECDRNTLLPGETGKVKIIIDTKGKLGPEVIIVKLYLNTKRRHVIIRINLNVV